jgi:signal transduction histidine kinase
VFHSGKVARIGFEIRTPAGELRYLDSRLMPEIGPDGSVESVLSVAADVTERERAEQALRNAHPQKDRFLATLAHELRNPLAPISNALASLRSPAAPALGQQALDVMGRQLAHLVRLVDDLLDVNRITHDKLELRKSAVDISDIIEAAVETSRPQIDLGQHALELALPHERIGVLGDRAPRSGDWKSAEQRREVFATAQSYPGARQSTPPTRW